MKMKIELTLEDLFGGEFICDNNPLPNMTWKVDFDNHETLSELKIEAAQANRELTVIVRLPDGEAILFLEDIPGS